MASDAPERAALLLADQGVRGAIAAAVARRIAEMPPASPELHRAGARARYLRVSPEPTGPYAVVGCLVMVPLFFVAWLASCAGYAHLNNRWSFGPAGWEAWAGLITAVLTSVAAYRFTQWVQYGRDPR